MPKRGNYSQFQSLRRLLENKAPFQAELQQYSHLSKPVLSQDVHAGRRGGD